jgi:glycerol-3-phosphate acyltransferase PlsY
MAQYWIGIIAVVLSYLLGAIPFGYLLVRLSRGSDVRGVGSGNTGATNVVRVTGWSIGLLTLILDVAKGYLAVFGTGYFTHQSQEFMALAALAAIIGHIFPVYLKFRGGKGVATSVGVFLCLATGPILGSLVIFAMVVALWRFVSLGSIIGTAFFALLYFLTDYRREPSLWILLSVLSCSSLVILKHKDNIQRLMAGTENKLTGSRQ